MPPTIRKVLIHSADDITKSILPIGNLSEGAQEARNKDLKNDCCDFFRKCSRLKTNEDILNSLAKINKRTMKTIPKELLQMLKTRYPNTSTGNNSAVESKK